VLATPDCAPTQDQAGAESAFDQPTMSRILSLCLLSVYLTLFVSALPSPDEQTLLAPSDPHVSNSWSWSDCGESPYHSCPIITLMALASGSVTDVIEIKSLAISPDPPKPGDELTVTASGYVSRTIEVCFSVQAQHAILMSMSTGWRNGGCHGQVGVNQAFNQDLRYL
jgi:hypothetical protein